MRVPQLALLDRQILRRWSIIIFKRSPIPKLSRLWICLSIEQPQLRPHAFTRIPRPPVGPNLGPPWEKSRQLIRVQASQSRGRDRRILEVCIVRSVPVAQGRHDSEWDNLLHDELVSSAVYPPHLVIALAQRAVTVAQVGRRHDCHAVPACVLTPQSGLSQHLL